MTIDKKALDTIRRDPDDTPAVRNALAKRRQLADVLAGVDARTAEFNRELQRIEADELKLVEQRVKGGGDLLVTDEADEDLARRRNETNEFLRKLAVRRSVLVRSVEAAEADVERARSIAVAKLVADGQALHKRIVAAMAEHLGTVAELNAVEREIMDSLYRASGRHGVQVCRFDAAGLPGDSDSEHARWAKRARDLGYLV